MVICAVQTNLIPVRAPSVRSHRAEPGQTKNSGYSGHCKLAQSEIHSREDAERPEPHDDSVLPARLSFLTVQRRNEFHDALRRKFCAAQVNSRRTQSVQKGMPTRSMGT
ncbi:hypothetical protein BVY10_10395, partial [Pseudomonas amygdali pv. morsprunorum]